MQRWKNILFNITFFFNCLLLFSVVFYTSLAIPAWVQVLGRMHPLLVHFPIVLLLVFIVWNVWLSKKVTNTEDPQFISDLLLLAAALSAALTALMGLLLSKETGYDADALALHKWSGISLAFFSFAWYLLRNTFKQVKFITAFASLIVFVLIIFTGHLGADITHGENYLLAPVTQEQQQPVVAMEDAVVFTNMVQPILQAKCIGCHNSKKAKGELLMETAAQLLKGGKDGPIWDTAQPGLSLMLKRIHLPEEEKKHMPPKGKPQLTNEEMDILYFWIKSGADFTTKVTALAPGDTLRLLAANIFKSSTEEVYNFEAADESLIQKLNNNNRVVVPVAIESPALAVDFYNSQHYNQEQLKELLKIKENIVSLNLARMPVKDDDLAIIAQFISLRKLNLSFSSITGKTIAALNKLPQLKELSLAGTAVAAKDLQTLATTPKLKNVFVWNTSLVENDIVALQKLNAHIQFEKGFRSDTIVMKLTPPILQNEEQVILQPVKLKLKHYVNGVTMRYTLDGTDPDSLSSSMYDSSVMLTKNGLLKAKAFKPGWISSDIAESYFYRSTYTPDSVVLLLPADAAYKGDGGKTLADHIKSDLSFKNGKWLGYHGTKMETLFMYNNPINISSVTLSSLTDIGGYIMPPVAVEVWGGNDPQKLKLLKRLTPQQPTKMQPGFMQAYDCVFDTATVKYIKVTATAVSKLPGWHPGKGQNGWFFIDEIFVN